MAGREEGFRIETRRTHQRIVARVLGEPHQSIYRPYSWCLSDGLCRHSVSREEARRVESTRPYRAICEQSAYHALSDLDKQIALRTIRFNPVSLAERMGKGSNEVGENDEIDIDALEVRPEEVYGPDQILKLIQSAEPGFAQTILTTFPLTGVRHGEALALMWRDIDFDQNEITIRRNWSGLYRDGELVFSTPKTKHSFRKLRNPGELSLALKKWKLQCPPSKWDLVFPRADGRPQDRKTTWRAFDAAIKKANENAREDQKLRRLTIHSLRHSFASIHLMNGTPIPDVSAMLGHANVNKR
jgi:integrase